MAYGQIVIADLILSGDNALIIGMAAAGLSPELRKRAILYGMVIAAVLRIAFAVIATTLLEIPGILFIGSGLLFWVCWRLFCEIREGMEREAKEATLTAENLDQGYTGSPRKTMAGALISITIADVSMSLDNVLAVAAIADGDKPTPEARLLGLLLRTTGRRLPGHHYTCNHTRKTHNTYDVNTWAWLPAWASLRRHAAARVAPRTRSRARASKRV